MSQPRRHFLRLFGVAAATLALGKSALVAAAAAAKDSAGMDYTSFVQRVGSRFKLTRAGEAELDVNLLKVVPLHSSKGYADERKALAQSFTLVLQSAERSTLAEGVYEVSTTGVATFQAFVSPIRGDGRSYQIVFSRG